nr:hypothetical protein [Microspora sp. UTEX LB472]
MTFEEHSIENSKIDSSNSKSNQENKEMRLELNFSQRKIANKWRKSGIKISKNLRDIIHGYTMSDGYISKGISCVDQGEQQESFVKWLHFQLKSIRTESPIKEVQRIHPKTKKLTRSYRFYTRAVLQGFHHIWYRSISDEQGVTTKYEKRLPRTINCFFNETFISLWFAGDGTKIIGSVGAKFEVTCFTMEERLIIQSLFLS